MSQQPAIGETVLVPADPSTTNGADEAPAIITRVWNPEMINVRVLGDNPDPPEWRTSLLLFDSREAMHRAQDAMPPEQRQGVPHAAYWPARV